MPAKAFVSASATGPATLTAPADTKIQFGTPLVDTASAWDDPNDQYIIPSTGVYQISGYMEILSQPNGAVAEVLIVANDNPALPLLLGTSILNYSGLPINNVGNVAGLVSLTIGTTVQMYGRALSATQTLGAARLFIHRVE